jgi:alginate O-acetyltransferase complex protein AlgI
LVVWGGLHGAYLVIERLWLRATSRRFRRRLARGASIAGIVLTFLLAALAWVFFRAPSLGHALGILGAMCGLGAGSQLIEPARCLLVAALAVILVAAHALEQRESFVARVARGPVWRHAVVLIMLLALLVMGSAPPRQFIYFGF